MSKTDNTTENNAKLAEELDAAAMQMARMEAVAASLADCNFIHDTRSVFGLFADEYAKVGGLLDRAYKAIYQADAEGRSAA